MIELPKGRPIRRSFSRTKTQKKKKVKCRNPHFAPCQPIHPIPDNAIPEEPTRPMLRKVIIPKQQLAENFKPTSSPSVVHQPPPRTPLPIAQVIPLTRRRLKSRSAMPGRPLPRFDKIAETPLRRRRRPCLEITVLSRAAPMLLGVLLLHSLIPQNAKREIRNAEAAQHDHRREQHSFVRYRLDERIENLGESVREDFGAGDFRGVLGPEALPLDAHGFQSGRAVGGGAAVVFVVFFGFDDDGDDVGACFEGFAVDVAADGGPEAVDYVGAAGEEEDVEEELGVEGEDVGDGRVGANEGEDRGDEALLEL